MARRRRITLEDLSPEHAAEARRQLDGGGVDLASLAYAAGSRDPIKTGGTVRIADRDLKPQKMPRPPRQKTKVERAYEDHLAILQAAGEVVTFAYEPLRLILAPKLTWCPDFAVLRASHERSGLTYACPRVQLVEVKPRRSDGSAFWTEDSRVKVKTAAQVHGVLFEVVAVWPNGRDGWSREAFPRRPE